MVHTLARFITVVLLASACATTRNRVNGPILLEQIQAGDTIRLGTADDEPKEATVTRVTGRTLTYRAGWASGSVELIDITSLDVERGQSYMGTGLGIGVGVPLALGAIASVAVPRDSEFETLTNILVWGSAVGGAVVGAVVGGLIGWAVSDNEWERVELPSPHVAAPPPPVPSDPSPVSSSEPIAPQPEPNSDGSTEIATEGTEGEGEDQ